MQRLDLTLRTPAENLALDEALLEWAEDEEDFELEFLRLWESPQPCIIVGRSSRVAQEVNLSECRQRQIPVVRRSSGGAAIVAGPGCLMYALVLSYSLRPELRDIRHAHAYVLGRLAEALQSAAAHIGKVTHAGTSDLVITGCGFDDSQSEIRNPKSEIRKFSGNSLRAKRRHLLYHGTLLYDFDLTLVESCLEMPSRQPDYRTSRAHRDFVTNLPLTRRTLTDAVDNAWPTVEELPQWPAERVAELVRERFGRDSWNLEFG